MPDHLPNQRLNSELTDEEITPLVLRHFNKLLNGKYPEAVDRLRDATFRMLRSGDDLKAKSDACHEMYETEMRYLDRPEDASPRLLSRAAFARELDVSEDTLAELESNGEILIWVLDDGRWVYPTFQIHNGRLLEHTNYIIRILQHRKPSATTIICSFFHPNKALPGSSTLLDLFRQGEVDEACRLLDWHLAEDARLTQTPFPVRLRWGT